MSTDEVTVRRSQEERENQKQRLSSQNPKWSGRKETEVWRKESWSETRTSRWAEGLEKSESKGEDKGESVEAAVGIETDGRRKEIADKILALAEKSELFCLFRVCNKAFVIKYK